MGRIDICIYYHAGVCVPAVLLFKDRGQMENLRGLIICMNTDLILAFEIDYSNWIYEITINHTVFYIAKIRFLAKRSEI